MQKQSIHSAISLSEADRSALLEPLSVTLASVLDAKLRVKHAHWNLRGAHFYARHQLFDDVADALEEQSDTVAERVAALGGIAMGSAASVQERSILPPYDTSIRAGVEHIEAVTMSLKAYCEHLRASLASDAVQRDPATEDMLIECLRATEFHLWSLDSHLRE